MLYYFLNKSGNTLYSLIIFDWDGTLIDSAERIVTCMQIAMREVGLPVLSDHAIRQIIGLGLPEAFQQLYPGIDMREMERMRDYYAKHFIGNEIPASQLFPGVAESLDRLKTQGFQLAVATGKSRKGLNRVFSETPWGDYFCASRCADETRSKPHPQMIHELLEETGVVPKRALMVGDTEFDMEMAQLAGVDRVAVSYGVHETERLKKYEPVLVVDQINQLNDWLAQQQAAKFR